MCMKATCNDCKKTTWNGCGQHVAGVLDSVPRDQLCSCGPKFISNGKEYPPKAK